MPQSVRSNWSLYVGPLAALLQYEPEALASQPLSTSIEEESVFSRDALLALGE